ncbi:unnamed protein product [Auanema sp. JU1783]|nr:unnamed protein product [Auanema sp. JU1783]
MDRLRRSIRQSFRRKRSPEIGTPSELVGNGSSSGRPDHLYQPDENAVRTGLCSFHVKYLGAVEVFESRGMQACEVALKRLRNSQKRPVKAVLYVSGDGIRVVDQQYNRGLIVDQTIEKVSFCAPDRHNVKGFAYICRDGTSRRWMCHGFHASKDTGDRLSHAVGCAFAICLERKKKRDEETTVTAEQALNPDWGEKSPTHVPVPIPEEPTNYAQRTNCAYQSFRKQISISERLQDPQSVIVNVAPEKVSTTDPSIAKPRPSANPALFQRQGSLRAPESSANAQFRRNYSLRAPSVESALCTNAAPTLFKEPIYEGDEEEPAQHTLGTAPNDHRFAYTDNQSCSSHLNDLLGGPLISTQPSTSNSISHNYSQVPVANQWSTFDSSMNRSRPSTSAGIPSAPSGVNQPISVNTQWNNTSPPLNSSRSKADEWLDGAVRSSMSFSSPPTTAQVTPSPSFTNGIPANIMNGVNLASNAKMIPNLESPLTSGPPPSHPPPPLPLVGAVANKDNAIRPNAISNTDAFGQSVNWDPVPQAVMPKPEDPFDIQWSRLTISSHNPFSAELSQNREVNCLSRFTINLQLAMILWTGFIFILPFVTCQISDYNKKLETDLFKNYNSRHRPVKKEQTTVNVSVFISISHVEKVDEHEQTMLLHGYLWSSWVDEYLNWKPSDYNGTTKTNIDAYRIWQPALALYNSARGNAWHLYMNSIPAMISSDGRVWTTGSFSFYVTCRFDFTDWPYDEQECPIVISDWVYDLSRVNLTDPNPDAIWNKPAIRLNYDPTFAREKKHVGGWEVSDAWRRHCYWGPGGCKEQLSGDSPDWYWSLLEFGVRVKRHAPYFRLTVVFPTLITCILTLCSFWIDTKSLAVSLLIFNILLQGLYGWDLIRELPPGSGGVPKIVSLYGFNLAMTALSFVIHVLIQYFEVMLPENLELPTQLRSLPQKLKISRLFEVQGLSFDPMLMLNADTQFEDPKEFNSPLASVNSSDALSQEQGDVLINMDTDGGTASISLTTPSSSSSHQEEQQSSSKNSEKPEKTGQTARQIYLIRRFLFCLFAIGYGITVPICLF